MEQALQTALVAIVCALLGSAGFWKFVIKKTDRNDAKTELLIGLAHDRIMYLGCCYIERGYITQEEYENLHEYLYVPYEKAGGNGSAKRVMSEVDKLPIHKAEH